jgi:hypothetical protein
MLGGLKPLGYVAFKLMPNSRRYSSIWLEGLKKISVKISDSRHDIKFGYLLTRRGNAIHSTAALGLISSDYMHADLFSVKQSLQSTLLFLLKE